MPLIRTSDFNLTSWQGGQHPTASSITKRLKDEKIIPYAWEQKPNYRYAVRSYTTKKILYVVDGTLEVTFPQHNFAVTLKAGDRIDIKRNVRYGLQAGKSGVKCLEASVSE
jgi:mannose-6-phosphate isomerase-like protein (cupin superfamily)